MHVQYVAPKGRNDAETEELADGHPRHGAAGSALCDPFVARQHLHGEDKAEERSSPSQASPRSWPSAGIEEQSVVMAKTEEVLTQLATRIPKELHRRLKLHCVTHEVSVMDFVVGAIEEKLGRKARPKKGTP